MKKFSWYTTKEKDKYGRYIGAEVFCKGGPFAFRNCYEDYKPNLKGGHRHNHVKNAHKRMKHCVVCDKPITKYEGFSSRFTGHICMECYIEECREHAVMAGIPTIGSLFDDLRNPYIRCKLKF